MRCGNGSSDTQVGALRSSSSLAMVGRRRRTSGSRAEAQFSRFGEVAQFRHGFAPSGRKAGGTLGNADLMFEKGLYVGKIE